MSDPRIIDIDFPDIIGVRKKEKHVEAPKRKEFSAKTKMQTADRQKNLCASCFEYVKVSDRDFHHKNGDRSDNSPRNCVMYHASCHREEEDEE